MPFSGSVVWKGVTLPEPPPVTNLSASGPITAIDFSAEASSGSAPRFSSSVIADSSMRCALSA